TPPISPSGPPIRRPLRRSTPCCPISPPPSSVTGSSSARCRRQPRRADSHRALRGGGRDHRLRAASRRRQALDAVSPLAFPGPAGPTSGASQEPLMPTIADLDTPTVLIDIDRVE